MVILTKKFKKIQLIKLTCQTYNMDNKVKIINKKKLKNYYIYKM